MIWVKHNNVLIFFKLLNISVVFLFTTAVFFSTSLYAYTPSENDRGNPNGPVRGDFRLLETSGTTAENSANFHVCSDPAYSKTNWVEGDGTYATSTGTGPYVVAGSASEIPSRDFDRVEKSRVLLEDQPGSCTTSNDPWDHPSNSDDWYVSAWVKPEALTCADEGNVIHFVTKWAQGASECSWRLWGKVIVEDGTCNTDDEAVIQLRASVDDSGGTFSCSSSCDFIYTASQGVLANDEWNHIAFYFEPDATTSRMTLYRDGRKGSFTTCFDTTDIPDPMQINNSTANAYIGLREHTVGGGWRQGFDGKIGPVKISTSYQQENVVLVDHLDDDMGNVVGGEGPNFMYGYKNNMSGTCLGDCGHYQKAAVFDGTDDYIEYINTSKFTNGNSSIDRLLVEAWVYPTATTPTGTLVSSWTYNDDGSCTVDTNNSTFRLYIDATGKPAFETYTSGGTKTVVATTAITKDSWYHILGYSSSTTGVQIYVNGQDDSSSSVTHSAPKTVYYPRVLLGATVVTSPGTTCASGTEDDFFAGYLDEVRVMMQPITAITNIPSKTMPSVVINEVAWEGTSDDIERIELLVLGDQNSSFPIDLHDHSITTCSQANVGGGSVNGTFAFSNVSYSTIAEAGDIIEIIVDDPTSGNTNTDCEGAATTCQWYTSTTTTTSPSRTLAPGDLLDAGDAIILTSNAGDSVPPQESILDAVVWGSAQGACQNYFDEQNYGLWQDEAFVETKTGQTLCLRRDGMNWDGMNSWQNCDDTMGALNTANSTDIELVSFEAIAKNHEVDITWVTGSEIDTFAYNLYVANHPNDFDVGGKLVNDSLIEARGGVGIGATYYLTDVNNNKNNLVYYQLEELMNSGSKNYYGPFQAQLKVDATNKGEQSLQNSASDATSSANGGDQYASNTFNRRGSCGQIVASDTATGPSLALILILLVLLSLRNFYLFD